MLKYILNITAAVFVLLTVFIQTVFFALSLQKLTASANDERYAYVAEDGVYLHYEPSQTSGLFTIPKSYYVLLLERGESFSKVRYLNESYGIPSIEGYCLTAQLTEVDYRPQKPFLDMTLSLIFTLSGTELYSPVLENKLLQTIIKEAKYVGGFKVGTASYSYVYMDGQFYYTPQSKPVDFPLSSEYADYLNSNAQIEPTKQASAQPSEALKLILLFAASALALGLVYYLFNKNQNKTERPRADYYYHDDVKR